MALLTAIGAGAQIIGPLIGMFSSSGDRDAANQAMQEALNEIMSIPNGPDLARPIILQKFEQAGILTPQVAQKLEEEVIPLVQLTEDKDTLARQMRGVNALEQLAKTGMGAEDLLALEQASRRAGQDAQARQKDITQNLSGGAALAAMLSSNQAADDRQSLENMQAAANASQNRRAALGQFVSAASGMRDQDYRTQSANMEAKMLRDQMLMKNAQARRDANLQYANQANIMNLQRQQQVSDQNVGAANTELQRQRAAEQQMYQNLLNRAQARSNALMGKAGQHQQAAANTAQSWSNIGGGVGGALTGLAGALQNQQGLDLKKDYLDLIKKQGVKPIQLGEATELDASLNNNPFFNV